MKKILVGILVVLSISIAPLAYAQGWYDSGIVLNPLTNDIIVDTGPLPEGSRGFSFFACATVGAQIIIEHRNAANNANIKSQGFFVPIGGCQSVNFGPPGWTHFVAQDERIRMRMNVGITGGISASIFHT